MDKNRIQDYIQTGTGTIAGYYAYKYGNRYIYKGNHKLLSGIKGKYTPEALNKVKEAGYQFFNNTPEFRNKKIKIIDLSQIDYNKFLYDKIDNAVRTSDNKIYNTNNPILRWFYKRKKNKSIKYIKYTQQRVFEGKNAYFNGKEQVVINMEKYPHAIFHELGHVQNHTHAKLLSSLRRNKLIKASPLIIILTSLLMPQKPNNTKDKNKIQKATYKTGEFIKNNCGKLMTLSFLPLVLEEGLASLRGQINAKKYLNKVDLKPVTRAHIHSFASYSAFAMTAGFAIFMANKIRDFIAEADINKFGKK